MVREQGNIAAERLSASIERLVEQYPDDLEGGIALAELAFISLIPGSGPA